MRALGWIAAGVVVGFMLGGIPAERERGALEARVAKLERELRRVHRPNILDNFLPQLGRPPTASDDAVGVRARAATASGGAPDAGSSPPGAEAQTQAQAQAGDPDDRPAPRGDVAVIGGEEHTRADAVDDTPERAERAEPNFEVQLGERDDRGRRPRGLADDDARPALERFDQLARVQRARAAASRTALIEQADLDEQQVARVDATVQRMNEQLTGYGEEMIEQMVRSEPPSPAQALGLGHDVSGILFEGQRELDAIVGEAAEDVEPSAMEVWNYVDIEQWRPLIEQHAPALERAAAGAETGEGQPPAAEQGGGAGEGAGEASEGP